MKYQFAGFVEFQNSTGPIDSICKNGRTGYLKAST